MQRDQRYYTRDGDQVTIYNHRNPANATACSMIRRIDLAWYRVNFTLRRCDYATN